jgi:hypothetical protein
MKQLLICCSMLFYDVAVYNNIMLCRLKLSAARERDNSYNSKQGWVSYY